MRTRDLRSIARDFRAGLLGNQPSTHMCYAVSAPLAGLLQSLYGVPCEVEEVWFDETPQGTTNHYWIRLGDGRILDATADQFGLEPVYIGPVPELYKGFMEGGDQSNP